MVKNNFLKLSLILLFSILPFITVLMLNSYSVTETMTGLADDSFGNTQAGIRLDENQDSGRRIVSLLNTMSVRYSLTSYQTDATGARVYRLYFNDRFAHFPMSEGRFFRKSDFKNGNNVAVVGKNLKSSVYAKDRKNYIRLNGVEYRVLGIIDFGSETVADNYIYVNMFSDYPAESLIYRICSFSDEEADEIAGTLIKKLSKAGVSASDTSFGAVYGGTAMTKIYSSRWYLILIIACAIAIFLCSVRWTESLRKEIIIRRLLGATRLNIWFRLFRQYFIILLGSAVILTVYCLLFYYELAAYLSWCGLGYAVVLAAFTVATALVFGRQSIGEAAK